MAGERKSTHIIKRWPHEPQFTRGGLSNETSSARDLEVAERLRAAARTPSRTSRIISDFTSPDKLKAVVVTRMNLLLIFAPLSMIAKRFQWGDGALFACALIALVPLAERLGFVTEQLAAHTNPTVGGLLNATFGNATEMIVSILAIRGGLLRVVQLSLLGSILSNMLLVLGTSFLLGGMRHKTQKYNADGVMMSAGLLLLSCSAMSLPAMLHASHTELHGSESGVALSRFCAAVLLLVYLAFLYFQLITHPSYYVGGDDGDGDEADEEPDEVLTLWGAIVWMGIITALISVLSDSAVDAIDGAAKQWAMPIAFISVIVLPIVGNAAEHASAVLFAVRNKMDITLGVAVGSSTQIALFVFPFCVLLAAAMDVPLDMNLHVFETATLLLTVVTVTFCVMDGRSNWLKGLTLVLAYCIVAGAFYCHAPSSPFEQEFDLKAWEAVHRRGKIDFALGDPLGDRSVVMSGAAASAVGATGAKSALTALELVAAVLETAAAPGAAASPAPEPSAARLR